MSPQNNKFFGLVYMGIGIYGVMIHHNEVGAFHAIMYTLDTFLFIYGCFLLSRSGRY